ncbi:MAG: response regulator [Pseudorhodoplanes sp.]
MGEPLHLNEHLPFLRRYARALSGSQRAGDVAVLATVKSLKGLAGCREETERELLYRAFSQIWNGPVGDHIRAISISIEPEMDMLRRLAQLPQFARQAFLLSSLENFGDEAIGRILGIDAAALPAAKAVVRDLVTRLVATKVLIIEDEFFIAADLAETMKSLGHEVIAVERTHADAVQAIETCRPGLVLADIQLADGSSGVDAANEILGFCEVPVVFITAYPERLLTGMRPEPCFILSKPIRMDIVCALTSQALVFGANARRSTPVHNVKRKVRRMS